jgi:hypothetical protein
MDPYEYEDLLAEVWEQLPRGVQEAVTLQIECDDVSDGPRTAIFTSLDGTRSMKFEVMSNGRISENAVLQLCVF